MKTSCLRFLLFPHLVTAIGIYTAPDKVLADHVYKSTYTPSWIDCIEICSAQTKCISYNYIYKGTEEGFCELNNCGFLDQCNAESGLLFSPVHIFQQVRQDTVRFICCQRERENNAHLFFISIPVINPHSFNIADMFKLFFVLISSLFLGKEVHLWSVEQNGQ